MSAHYGGRSDHYRQQALNSLGGQTDGVGSTEPAPSQGFVVQREGPGVLDEEISVGSRFSVGSEDDLRTAYSRESRFSPRRLTRVIRQSIGSWDRNIQGKTRITWFRSATSIASYSWLNIFLLFLPFAWALHFGRERAHISHAIIFGLCFLTLIPLSKLLEYGGEQLALYCGQQLGDLIAVTLSNAVEATLAVFLLVHCELKLLQSSIIGVIILRLLLLPGLSFIIGGVDVDAQELHPHLTQLNHTLLTIGCLALLLPAAYFAALDKGAFTEAVLNPQTVVNDSVRGQFLKVSRGLAVVMLIVYIASRYFLHAPPTKKQQLHTREDAPSSYIEKVRHFEDKEPEVNLWACVFMLVIAVPLMAVTAQFLVESIEPVRKKFGIQEEWFGLILLPIVSFSADGLLASAYYIRYLLKRYMPHSSYISEPYNPSTLAETRAIDLSIQFAIFWLPLFVLVGWAIGKPFTLLFDMFEVAVLLGACFLVNYVTADSKTNWAEGAMMVAFYIMIAITAWFYPGQPEVHAMLSCEGVAEAVSVHLEHLVQLTDDALKHSPLQLQQPNLLKAGGCPADNGGRGDQHDANDKHYGSKDLDDDDEDGDDDEGATIDLSDDGHVVLKAKDIGELMDTMQLLDELYQFV